MFFKYTIWLFLFCYGLLNCPVSKAQVFEPVMIVNKDLKRKGKGYFFIVPHKKKKGIDHQPPKTSKQIIMNSDGEIVFFRYTKAGSDFKQHPNGLISYWSGRKFYVLDKSLAVIDSVACVNGIRTDWHDFVILPNGHYLLFGKERKTKNQISKELYNIKKEKVSKRVSIVYDVIQELDKAKNIVFQWSSKDYFNAEDIDSFYLTDTVHIDVTHFNSIDADANGNILISVRHFNEVLKIRRSDGSIIWRMGGKHNQIKVLNDTIPFLGQHDARFTGSNTFSLFDNGYYYDSLRHFARGLEYEIDDSAKTAKVIWSYSYNQPITSISTGNLQKINKKLWLINYGNIRSKANITCELLNDKKQAIQTLSFKDSLASYRTFFYPKLPFKLKQPVIKTVKNDSITVLSTKQKYNYYLWSNGEQTPEIKTTLPQNYYVFVSSDGVSYTRSNVKKLVAKRK